MKKIALLFAFAVTMFASEISISGIYAKVAPNGVNGAIFMTIENGFSSDIKLIKATSTNADSTEIHTHKNIDGMMMMQQINYILIPKQNSVKLLPGGLHIMLIGLKEPLTQNSNINVTLEFDTGKVVKIDNISLNGGQRLFLEK